MHVDGDQYWLQPALHPLGQADIAVLDAGHAEDRETVGQYNGCRNVEQDQREPIDPRGEYILDRMVAHRGCHIDIGIRMVQRVKAPEEGYSMLAPVHGVAHQVQQ